MVSISIESAAAFFARQAGRWRPAAAMGTFRSVALTWGGFFAPKGFLPGRLRTGPFESQPARADGMSHPVAAARGSLRFVESSGAGYLCRRDFLLLASTPTCPCSPRGPATRASRSSHLPFLVPPISSAARSPPDNSVFPAASQAGVSPLESDYGNGAPAEGRSRAPKQRQQFILPDSCASQAGNCLPSRRLTPHSSGNPARSNEKIKI